jgi:predicted secreted protein
MAWRLCAVAGSVLAFSLTACSPGPSVETTVMVDCEEFQSPAQDTAIVAREIAVSEGSFIELWLCSNPSTGFEWEEAALSDASVLKETDHEFVAPDSAKEGAAGQEHWTFEATGSGHCTVSLLYSRPWEGGEKGAWEFKLDVQVR